MDWDKASAELRKKLDPANVKPAKDFGPKGDYIEGWHAIAEANRIFGFDGWNYSIINTTCVANEPRKIGKAQKDGWGVSYIATVMVAIGEVMREDIGAGHGYDADLGLAHESAIKEAVTDALKRALRSFGNPFGLALYDKSRENVGHNPPDADPVEISTAIDTINACETADGLAAHWRLLNRNAKHVAADHRVIAAKDTRKLALAGVYPPN
jgi:DNA repair and recombination protein RAD52